MIINRIKLSIVYVNTLFYIDFSGQNNISTVHFPNFPHLQILDHIPKSKTLKYLLYKIKNKSSSLHSFSVS